MTSQPVRARALRPGDRIAVVSPSSPVVSPQRLDDGLEVLRRWGYQPLLTPNALAVHGHLAGDDDRRVADLNDAFRDPSVRAIWASRGGYGTTRILDRLDWDALAADPKLLVGFSDITALLLAAWRRVRLVTIHGQFVGRLGLQPETTLRLLHDLVRTPGALGVLPRPEEAPLVRRITGGAAEGRLLGGNLSLLTSLLGTPDAPDLDGAILFLEDVGETPYRLDRMLTQLRTSGTLGGVAGVVVGELRDCDPPGDRPSSSVGEVVDELVGGLGVPAIADVAVGHVDRQVPLPIGAIARLDADAATLEILEPAVTDGQSPDASEPSS